MLLFNSKLSKNQSLNFVALDGAEEHLMTVATWAESEWGYIRHKGVNFRMQQFVELRQSIYVGLLNGAPVAMFALLDHEFTRDLQRDLPNLPHFKQLMFVYVDERYRGLGFGRQIIQEAKQRAQAEGAELVLDTLKPGLNGLYRAQGAHEVCEGRLYSNETDVLRMKF